MKKISITELIKRYNLAGNIESVKINSTDDGMSVEFISDDKTLLGKVSSNESKFPNGEFGVYTTAQLKSLLSILNDEIAVTHKDSFIRFKDNITSVDYVLSDLSIIPDVPELKQIPEFEANIKLTDDFINTFIKSKSALSDADTFTFLSKSGVHQIILGYSTLNTNRVTIEVDANVSSDVNHISFSSSYLKEILLANRDSETMNMMISSQGLCYLEFVNSNFSTKYYMVELK